MRSQSQVLLLGGQLALALRRHAYSHEQLPNVAALYARHLATAPPGDASDGAKESGWMPSWVKSKLPGVLGGTKESIEELTLDCEFVPSGQTQVSVSQHLPSEHPPLAPAAFARGMAQARRLGSLTGFVHGTRAISDPAAKGTLRLFETIVGAMRDMEKANLASFGAEERARVAAEVGCTTSQVDDCIARYLWMKSMTRCVALSLLPKACLRACRQRARL